ncbi:high frequency lysogenization protein HflD [Aquisalimonas sp.]|uniref:high frequency lysogenization protein HflD n=1 Tax=Aquisalimonas sp. TaxID=1872621 RepID=UPI0025C00F0C|nr:high frequency lysogenization protein HflD [Aquisalimonas sp.]
MQQSMRNQTLALAALFQALSEVRRIARTGQANMDEVGTCMNGLLNRFDGDIGAAYGGEVRLLPGLHRLRDQLSDPQDQELTRYAIVLMHLERKLMRQRTMLAQLADGIEQASRQAEHFHPAHENVIGRLADLYGNTISTLKPKVMVQGERQWLEDPRNTNQVRALLLAGIRATTFWRTAGGSRMRLVFRRNQLLQASDQLARELAAGTA